MQSNVYLKDILNVAVLDRAIRDGYIREQTHPTEPLKIFNYTQKAVFEGVWNEATRMCRGLIINTETLCVVARPFAKFFNYGEDKASHISLGEIVTVTDKIDGSLGIQYWMPKAKRWAIATRGSFTSEQAVWATDWLQKYGTQDYFNIDYTYLYEILATWNRIVIEYNWEGLVLLAIQDTRGNRIDLPDDPRVLSARVAPNDCSQH